MHRLNLSIDHWIKTGELSIAEVLVALYNAAVDLLKTDSIHLQKLDIEQPETIEKITAFLNTMQARKYASKTFIDVLQFDESGYKVPFNIDIKHFASEHGFNSAFYARQWGEYVAQAAIEDVIRLKMDQKEATELLRPATPQFTADTIDNSTETTELAALTAQSSSPTKSRLSSFRKSVSGAFSISPRSPLMFSPITTSDPDNSISPLLSSRVVGSPATLSSPGNNTSPPTGLFSTNATPFPMFFGKKGIASTPSPSGPNSRSTSPLPPSQPHSRNVNSPHPYY